MKYVVLVLQVHNLIRYGSLHFQSLEEEPHKTWLPNASIRTNILVLFLWLAGIGDSNLKRRPTFEKEESVGFHFHFL